MRSQLKTILCTLTFFSLSLASIDAKTITFSNMTWQVREGTGGPGPNNWSSNNAWVDSNGWLHLKITKVNNKWYCPEIYTTNSLGFGRYTYYLNTRVDNLDPNVVLGLFHYPTSDVGPDGTNEIDIEFAKWGQTSSTASNASYTVWPVDYHLPPTSLSYKLTLNGDYTTYGYTWSSHSIYFQSSYGHYPNYDYPIKNWNYAPSDYLSRIAQKPMPLHINLWLFNGRAPMNKSEVEIVIEKVCFVSEDGTQSNCR